MLIDESKWKHSMALSKKALIAVGEQTTTAAACRALASLSQSAADASAVVSRSY